ncbi:MAG: LacI family transcriptional regulator [Chloroflexi bacterium]|nr:LacI family transcriptional regulator [Chloroflexota bacterium]
MQDSPDITIAEVAEVAGVSVSTVSRILNDKPDVAERTRQRVQQVIEELGYTPHAQAQRLATGKSSTSALLYDFDYIDFTRQEMGFIRGVGRAFGEAKVSFNLITTAISKEELRNLYRSGQVDGVILMEIDMTDWRVDFLRERNYPFVMIGRSADNTGLHFVDLDQENVVITAFDHLVELGHRQVGFIAFPESLLERGYGAAVRLKRGYKKACEKHGLTPICLQVDLAVQALFESTLKLLQQKPDITAIVTIEGSTTVGIIRALQHLGRAIPGDFSIMTITSEQTAQLISPPLTFINFPSYELGFQAAQMLTSILNKEPVEVSQVLLPPQLIVRESTGPASP